MNIIKFIEEVKQEFSKITWPKRANVIQMTIMVVILASLDAVFFFGVDQLFGYIVQLLFKR